MIQNFKLKCNKKALPNTLSAGTDPSICAIIDDNQFISNLAPLRLAYHAKKHTKNTYFTELCTTRHACFSISHSIRGARAATLAPPLDPPMNTTVDVILWIKGSFALGNDDNDKKIGCMVTNASVRTRR